MDGGEIAERALAYLHASTAGDWDEAATYVATRARLVFPNGEFSTLDELRHGLQRRYTDLIKHIETTDIARRADGTTVVVVSGTLSGINLNGVPFSGVRFLDRLVVRDGLVVEQDVYNDLAVAGVLDRGSAPHQVGDAGSQLR